MIVADGLVAAAVVVVFAALVSAKEDEDDDNEKDDECGQNSNYDANGVVIIFFGFLLRQSVVVEVVF